MHRPARTHRLAAIAVAVAAVGGACQSEGDGDADATIGGTPIEEPSTVTEPTDPTEPSAASPPADDGTADTDRGTDAEDTAPSADDTTEPADPTLVLASQPQKTTPPVATAPPGEPSTETIYDVGTIDPGLAPFVEIATDDLAGRLDVDPASIEVLTAVLVTWPDAALGCREPDRLYATVLTDGSVIELGSGGLVYRYHSGGERGPFPCDRPLDPVPVPLS